MQVSNQQVSDLLQTMNNLYGTRAHSRQSLSGPAPSQDTNACTFTEWWHLEAKLCATLDGVTQCAGIGYTQLTQLVGSKTSRTKITKASSSST